MTRFAAPFSLSLAVSLLLAACGGAKATGADPASAASPASADPAVSAAGAAAPASGTGASGSDGSGTGATPTEPPAAPAIIDVQLHVSNKCPHTASYCVADGSTLATDLPSSTSQTHRVSPGAKLMGRDGSSCTSEVLYTVEASSAEQEFVVCKP